MTERVIEIRLGAPLPAFLQLLAQPQFGILSKDGGTGPYRAAVAGEVTVLTPLTSATADGELPEPVPAEQRMLRIDRAAMAVTRFKAGAVDLVIGGRFQHLRLVPAAGLAFADLRVDPVSGLFGLAFTGTSNFVNDITIRDALSRVVDRAAFASKLGFAGWQIAEYPLPASLELDRAPSVPAWAGQPMGDRIDSARKLVDRWTASQGDAPVLRIALPDGAGATMLFVHLARDFRQIGVQVDRVAIDAPADLRLIDEVAPFDSAFWYLSRLDCAAKIVCDPSAAAVLASARETHDATEQARLLGEAEQKIVAYVGYIPLGAPIRWSLVSKRLTGFALSPRGIHPLNRLVRPPN